MTNPATSALINDPVLIFFIVLVIILLAPLLLNRLKIPHIIGLIVAGIVVGPYGIDLLARDSSFRIFGQVGVLYLMFLAGIEIDMFHLKKNLGKGLVFGLYTFLVPMVIGTLTSVWMLGMDWLTAVLLASMYASHTLVAYPIVSRFGLTKSPTVIITIAGTIVTVVGALIVLAICVGIYTEGMFQAMSVLGLVGRLVLYCLALVYIYPRVTRWFFKTYSDNITQFIYVLAMVFMASYAAQCIGVESVLGAFFAGLVLNRYIPNMSPLMNRIEFVGNAIFIPYFLIGVGMLINMKVVVSSWDTVYVAVVMSVVATLCKWIAAWFTQLTYRMPSIDRKMMFGLSNAQAAATLAAVMIGYNIGIFDITVLNGTVVMILVTCTISSIVTERASMRMKTMIMESDASSRPDSDVKAPSMMIAVANPVTVSSLVDLALLMRSSRPSRRGPLYAVHVRNDNSSGSRAIGHNCLEIAVKTAASVDTPMETIERYDLNFVTGLLNTINERDINQLVIGMHHRSNIIDTFFGNKIEQLITSTNRMLVITRCFIPVSTLTRIVVLVPDKAQYETGFALWVTSLGNLSSQLGCRLIFCCHPELRGYIRSVLTHTMLEVRAEYRDIEEWDDVVLLANRILDDDLFVVVSARRASISFNPSMDRLPGFLQKYFGRNNLIVLYPEQFGEATPMSTAFDPLATDITAPPGELWLRIMAFWKRLIQLRKRFTQRRRRQHRKIDL